jgi:hypothetical protein
VIKIIAATSVYDVQNTNLAQDVTLEDTFKNLTTEEGNSSFN